MLWQKSMHYGTKPSSLTKMSWKRSTWNVSRPEKTQHLKHSPKFTVPIGQILCKFKNEPWFELPPPMKGDLTRLDHTKYCAFHQGPSHTTNGCLKWKQYLEKLTNEGQCDEYLVGSTKRPTQPGEVFITP